MGSFKEWLNERPASSPVVQPRKWKATKDEIIQYWKNLRADTPILMTPIPYEHEGTTYSQDGVRITGSKEFIGSVLARLKEFLQFESPQTKLQVVFRQTDKPTVSAYDNRTSFVFYIQAKSRGSNQMATPKPPKPKLG